MTSPAIRLVDPAKLDKTVFRKAFADCVVLTKDRKILLQQRPPEPGRTVGALTAFGGHVESGETPLTAMIRELREELGAIIDPRDVILLGAVTEAVFEHKDVVHCYFWHDQEAVITGCYEWEAVAFDTAADALAQPGIMDYLAWALGESRRRGLLT